MFLCRYSKIDRKDTTKIRYVQIFLCFFVKNCRKLHAVSPMKRGNPSGKGNKNGEKIVRAKRDKKKSFERSEIRIKLIKLNASRGIVLCFFPKGLLPPLAVRMRAFRRLGSSLTKATKHTHTHKRFSATATEGFCMFFL